MSTEAFPLIRPSAVAEGCPAGRLGYRIVPVGVLSGRVVGEMLRLFRAHFELSSTGAFHRDLQRKQFVILIRDAEGRLHGFSTITSFRTAFRGRDLGVVYSGDTIIRPESWGTSVLPRAWLEVVMEMAVTLPRPLYWLLLSSGYKTYRMLPVFFRTFYPRLDVKTPGEVRDLMGHLGRTVAGRQFDAEGGIIRFGKGATPLRPGVAEVGDRDRKDPHTAFFLGRNPGHLLGDELVCLAEISDDNLARGGRRILRAMGKERLE